MTEKDKITESKLKQKGIFDFKETYQFAYRWLVEEGYDVNEDKYIEEVGGDSKNIEIKWVATKKVSDYFKNEIKLGWRILRMKNVEVEKNGKKVNMNDGTIEVKFTGTLLKDYQSTWEKNPVMKFLRTVYDKYIITGRVEQYEVKLFQDVEDLEEQIKAFLVIEGMK